MGVGWFFFCLSDKNVTKVQRYFGSKKYVQTLAQKLQQKTVLLAQKKN